MALHLFDPDRHELTLACGTTVSVRPSAMGHWPRQNVRLPIIVKQWALKQRFVADDDVVAVLEFTEEAAEPA